MNEAITVSRKFGSTDVAHQSLSIFLRVRIKVMACVITHNVHTPLKTTTYQIQFSNHLRCLKVVPIFSTKMK